MARYDKEFVIGSGTFGTVWIVKSKLSRESYVLKEINLSSLGEKERDQALNELAVLAKCKHKHIIRYKDSSFDQEKRILSIIMEHARGGDLQSAIINQGGDPFSEQRVLTWFVEICLALQYIHRKNILHRDLKSQNIFLNHNNVAKLGDFGIARVLNEPDELAKTAIGTPLYLSPEICQRKSYGYKSDIWALGCLLFEMAALEHPFVGQDLFHVISLILEGKRKLLPNHCSLLIRDMVDSLLNLDDEQRPSAKQILAHPALQAYISACLLKESSKNKISLSSTTSGSSPRRVSTGKQEFPDMGAKLKQHKSTQNSRTTKRSVSSQGETAVSSARRVSGSNRELPNTGVKRKARATQNSKPRKRTVSLQRETAYQRPRCPTNPTYASKRGQKNESPVKNGKSVATSCSDGSKAGLGKTLRRDFTTSCGEPFSPDILLRECNTPFSKSDDFKLEDDVDYGYCTETPTKITPTRIHSRLMSSNADLPTLPLPKTFQENNLTNCNDVTDYMTYSTADISRRVPETHEHCHSQCQQCMLDMLWRNRIRNSNKSQVDTDELLRLENKLLSIFKNKFKKVHKALAYDWEERNVDSSHQALGSIVNSLTYEEVQSLPLMMQLVQLECLMKTE